MPSVLSRAACVFVLRDGDKGPQVLLLERADTLQGAWCQVAGSVEQGETAWQCALRELAEETGLVPAQFWTADVCEQFYVPAKDVVEVIPVFVARVAPDSKVHLNAEHSDFAWLSVDEAQSRVSFASQRHILRHIHAEFIVRAPSDHLLIPIP